MFAASFSGPGSSAPGNAPWKAIAIAATALAGVIAIVAVIALITSRPPEEKIGSVTAPGFNPGLAGGGLSSNQIGSAALLASVRTSESTGFQILQDGVDESVIDDFKQVPPRSPWTSQFSINNGTLILKFRNRNRFLLNYPRALGAGTADDLFRIASRYGFLSAESSASLTDLNESSAAFVETFIDRPLTIGVAESDLVAEAAELAAAWEAWIKDNPESSSVKTARQTRNLVLIAGDVAANPDNSKIDYFNAALQRIAGE